MQLLTHFDPAMVSSAQQSNRPSLQKFFTFKKTKTLILASTGSSQGKTFKMKKNQGNNTGSLWVKMSQGSLKTIEKAKNDRLVPTLFFR